MARLLRGIAVVILLAVLCLRGPAAAEPVLNLYIWSDYLAPDTLSNFTKATGIKVNVDVFDSAEMLEAKLLAGGSGYDVVVPNGPTLRRFIQAGIVRPLDKAKLPNLATQDPAILARAGEGLSAHGIVYMWGTSGIGYNPAKVRAALGADIAIDSWKALFDPALAGKLARCGVYVFDSQADVFEVALNYLGLDPHSTNSADYEKAANLWKSVRPSVAKFHNSEYIAALANGDICVAMGFSGDVYQAAARAKDANNGVEIKYAIPKEGAVIWADFMAIPKDAPHADAAYAFLNYILDPKVIGPITNKVYYANANTQAAPFVDPKVLADKTVYPDQATLAHLFGEMAPSPEIERLRTRLWNRVKSGQ
jgi:putrescine transport system substrate-binding protein